MTRQTARPTGNADALRESRQLASETKREAVLAATQALLSEGLTISISEVAARARVSRQFVYSHKDLQAVVEAAMATQRNAEVVGQRAPRQTSSANASLRADLAIAEQELGRLRAEVAQLRSDLALDLGAEIESRDRASAAEALAGKVREVERLMVENSKLTLQVANLQRQVEVLTDDLAAERRAAMVTAQASAVTPLHRGKG